MNIGDPLPRLSVPLMEPQKIELKYRNDEAQTDAADYCDVIDQICGITFLIQKRKPIIQKLIPPKFICSLLKCA